jgi:Putative viral replication protein
MNAQTNNKRAKPTVTVLPAEKRTRNAIDETTNNNGKAKTSRAWCFTVNVTNKDEWNPSEVGSELVRYLVCQLEQAPTTGQLHYQGYAEFKNAIRMAQCKNILNSRWVHVEPRRGTRDEAREYCMTEETRVAGPWEFGKWVGGGQGTRSDLQSAIELVKQGKTSQEIASELPEVYIRNHAGIDKMVSMTRTAMAPERRNMAVHIHYGVPGSGKTWKAREDALASVKRRGESDYFDWPSNTEQPVGYNGQSVVVIEEFNGWIPASTLKKFLDVYKANAKVPYTTVPWMAQEIYITSNYDPKTWYTKDVEWKAIARRVNNGYGSLNYYPEQHPDVAIRSEDLVPNVVRWSQLQNVSARLVDAGMVPVPGTRWVSVDEAIAKKKPYHVPKM